MTDGPFAEGKEHMGGFTVISVPDLDAALDWGRRIAEITTLPVRGVAAAGRRDARPGRSAGHRRRLRHHAQPRARPGHRAGVPRGVRAGGVGPGPRVRRHRHRRGRGPGRLRPRRGALARRRAAAQPGRLDHHHRPQPGDRPAAPGSVPGRPARPGRAAARQPGRGGHRTRPGGARARRPAPAAVHLLPSRAEPGRPGRADPPAARRADHHRDRARVPGAGADHGPAAGPGQGQDPGRADPLPGAGRGGPARPPGRRAGRGVPHLQRGVHGQHRRPADPARTCAPRRSGSGGCWPR